jgi:hypothetical protein
MCIRYYLLLIAHPLMGAKATPTPLFPVPANLGSISQPPRPIQHEQPPAPSSCPPSLNNSKSWRDTLSTSALCHEHRAPTSSDRQEAQKLGYAIHTTQRLSFFRPLALARNLPQVACEADPRPASVGNGRIGSYIRRHLFTEYSWRLRMPWKHRSLGHFFHKAGGLGVSLIGCGGRRTGFAGPHLRHVRPVPCRPGHDLRVCIRKHSLLVC